ncbi:MAG TPA: hypothetical protein VGH54_23525 [Mycobacterium sp.]|jgi:hypothetical protein|uniref:hypothetical protein n=1 Tax=Mycobacterium sp. TaxID=1785 RepID=UPI002F40734C
MKIKFTPYIQRATLERARATVAALRGQVPEAHSLNDLIDSALRRECARLERAHNGGQAYPAVETMPGSGGRRQRAPEGA